SPSPTAKPSPSPTATPSPTAKPASLKIRYHSVPTASGMYRVGVAIRQAVMADYPELDVTIISTSSVLERIELARAGTTDIFEVQYEALYRAHNGTEDFKGKAMTDGRTMYAPGMAAITLFATKDSGVKSVYELTGKSYGSYAGTSTEQIHRWLFEALGIQPKWDAAGTQAMYDAVKARRTIGFGKTGSPEPGIIEIAATLPITILEVTAADIAKANAARPGQFHSVIIPKGTYPGQDKDVLTFGLTDGDAAYKGLSEEVAYKWLKAVNNHRNEIAKSAPGSSEVYADVLANTLKLATVPLHLGAYKLYRELGITVPKELIPPEASK
ncbi:MAG: TAXI family TRAP transporter solute-binding subunit, partial [Dehalococcoidales bacterium]|nr:TAXI family TRAP transporter solute-binding subunit [Dehalococcoidales bacterium]